MNPYIKSLRLRTLPLSMAGIILGTGLAGWCNWLVFVWAMLTTVSLQILSNLSNELGDAMKGTDANQHGREAYGLQAGTITERQMKGMIWLFVGLSVLFGTALIYSAFGTLLSIQSGCFFVLGLLAIAGAVTYTLGKHSYGYMGLGDVGVFLFFGLLSTMGAYYLQTRTMAWEVFWSGVAIGLPCIGVLNLNNIRDMSNDRAHGKHTFAGLLGGKGARVYHLLLLSASMLVFLLQGHYLVAAVFPVWVWHFYSITVPGKDLDKQMPVLAISTLLVAVLACFM